MKRANKQHEINLIVSYNRKKGNEKDKYAWFKEYRLLVIALVVMVILSGSSIGYMLIQKRHVDMLNKQINDPVFVKDYKESQELESKSDKLLSQCSEIDRLIMILATYPKASSDVNNKIVSLSSSSINAEIIAYDAKTGILKFIATSKDNMQINSFIQRLSDSKLFSNVVYSGYSYQNDIATYSVHVQCYLASNAGKGDQGE